MPIESLVPPSQVTGCHHPREGLSLHLLSWGPPTMRKMRTGRAIQVSAGQP